MLKILVYGWHVDVVFYGRKLDVGFMEEKKFIYQEDSGKNNYNEDAESVEQKVEISYRVVESFGAQMSATSTTESKENTFKVKVVRGDENKEETYSEADKIREDNLKEFYQSAYYQNVQRKKSNRIKVIAVIAALVLIYLGFVAIGGALISGKDKVAGTESEKLEMAIEKKYGVIINTGSEINAIQNDYLIYELDSNAQTYEALQAI